MKHRRLLFLWLLVANLLCGQQVALAHMVGHLGGSPQGVVAPTVDDGDSGHGSLASLSHVCTTCAALAGFDLPLAATVQVFGSSADAPDRLVSQHEFHLPTSNGFQFQSRAPPHLQN